LGYFEKMVAQRSADQPNLLIVGFRPNELGQV